MLAIVAAVLLGGLGAQQWEADILPPEHEVTADPVTGARLIYVTSHGAEDTNLYFHQWSWLPDSSLLLFRSNREGASVLFGYIEATGELARLQPEGQPGLMGDVTASRHDNAVYLMRENQVLEWRITVHTPEGGATRVTVDERVAGKLPQVSGGLTGLNESSDGSMLVFGFTGSETSQLVWMDRATGEVRHQRPVPGPIQHVQTSWDIPSLAMYATGHVDRARPGTGDRWQQRMWLLDGAEGTPRKLYHQLEGELVTHEQFWVNNQVVFCSGEAFEGDAAQAHVKVVDINTGVARILCAGAWWQGAETEAEAAAKVNWWHCSGAPNGRYVAADNWHGDIAIASGMSARHRILTTGHRTYGKGAHPHVGWDPTGYRVVFATNQRGNSDVCIAELPDSWRGEW